MFRNPLADPYLLGAAAGAGLGATLVIAYSPRAVARAVRDRAAGRLRRRAGRRRLRPALGTAAAARTAPPCCWPGSRSPPSSPPGQTLVQQQNTDDLREVYGWLLGQLGRAQWSDVVLVLPYLGPRVRRAAALRAARSTCSPSATTRPASLGVHPGRLRLLVILAASLATAVGRRGQRADRLRRPGRAAHRPPARRRLARPGAAGLAAVGGAFLVLADLVARVVLAPAELPIGVVTAFIGAPFFAGLLWVGARRR